MRTIRQTFPTDPDYFGIETDLLPVNFPYVPYEVWSKWIREFRFDRQLRVDCVAANTNVVLSPHTIHNCHEDFDNPDSVTCLRWKSRFSFSSPSSTVLWYSHSQLMMRLDYYSVLLSARTSHARHYGLGSFRLIGGYWIRVSRLRPEPPPLHNAAAPDFSRSDTDQLWSSPPASEGGVNYRPESPSSAS